MKRKEERLSKMIMDYLRRHPNARDTLEGITKWWLELERIDTSVDEVANTLKNLVKKGMIRVYEDKCGKTFYKYDYD